MTLRRELICPNCDGREIWRVERMPERGPGSDLSPLGIRYEFSFLRGQQALGQFETLICKACGYTEWYAKATGFLKHDPANGVHLIVNEIDAKGPYR